MKIVPPSGAPPLELPPQLEQMLTERGGDLLARVARFLESSPRPCTYATSERVANRPLRVGRIAGLLGRSSSPPTLGKLESKFGGMPYYEEPDLEWSGHAFLGQMNFADIAQPPPGSPRKGIFALDSADKGPLSFRTRWYPDPREAAAQEGPLPPSLGPWEARLRFKPGWSLPPSKPWTQFVPDNDDAIWDAWNDWEPAGYLEDERDLGHRILGHPSSGLDEHYGFEPPPGRAPTIEDYEMLWRITYDNTAGFAWGTNWVYVIIHRDDLAAARLERAVVTAANY
jgi:hypothetical protein